MFAFRGFEANCILHFCVCRRAIAKIKCQGGLLIERYLHVTVTKNGQSKRERGVLFGVSYMAITYTNECGPLLLEKSFQ